MKDNKINEAFDKIVKQFEDAKGDYNKIASIDVSGITHKKQSLDYITWTRMVKLAKILYKENFLYDVSNTFSPWGAAMSIVRTSFNKGETWIQNSYAVMDNIKGVKGIAGVINADPKQIARGNVRGLAKQISVELGVGLHLWDKDDLPTLEEVEEHKVSIKEAKEEQKAREDILSEVKILKQEVIVKGLEEKLKQELIKLQNKNDLKAIHKILKEITNE